MGGGRATGIFRLRAHHVVCLTLFTVLWAGAYQTNTNPLVGPWDFLLSTTPGCGEGIPFCGDVARHSRHHELGHYVLSRLHGVPTSLPLFVPGLLHFVGTFGAIIRGALR